MTPLLLLLALAWFIWAARSIAGESERREGL